jgi:dephospho-CoA kinase
MKCAKKRTNRPAMVIAVTGAIASGKSTVSGLLSQRGFPVIDTDALARQAVKPGEPALEKLVRALGQGILRADMGLDRALLLDLMLSDRDVRRLVGDIIHPCVHRRMDQMLQELAASGRQLAVVEVPLLFEAGWEGQFDFVVAVTAPESECIERLIQRNRLPREKAVGWLAAQTPQEEKARRSDFVIRNDGDIDKLQAQVDALTELLRKKAHGCYNPKRGYLLDSGIYYM